MSSLQLTSYKNYNTSNLVFSKPTEGVIPTSTTTKAAAMTYRRSMIYTKYPNGVQGDLILESPPNLFSFGIQKQLQNDVINGHNMPICLYARDGASQDEQDFVETLDKITEAIKLHMIENRLAFNRYDLTMEKLDKCPVYRKKDELGNVVPGSSPTLYAKLIEFKNDPAKQQKFKNTNTQQLDGFNIYTQFWGADGSQLTPESLLEKQCSGTFAVKFESIFASKAKASIIVKLYEAQLTVKEANRPSLLASRNLASYEPKRELVSHEDALNVQASDTQQLSKDDDDDDGEEYKPQPPQPAAPKMVKRTVKTVKSSLNQPPPS